MLGVHVHHFTQFGRQKRKCSSYISIPHSTTLANWIEILAAVQHFIMIQDVGESSFALCVDGWQSCDMVEKVRCEEGEEDCEERKEPDENKDRQEMLGIIGVYINPDYDLCFSLLRFSYIPNQKTLTIIGEVEMATEELNRSQIVAMTTDNASNMKSVGTQICGNWIGCNCHALHLIFTNTYKIIPSCCILWKKVDKICTLFGKRKASEMLERALTERNEKRKGLQHPILTRWWTYARELQSIINFYDDIERIVIELKEEEKRNSYLFSSQERALAIGVCTALVSIRKIGFLLEGGDKPYGGEAIFQILNLVNMYDGLLQNNSVISETTDSWWGNLHAMLHGLNCDIDIQSDLKLYVRLLRDNLIHRFLQNQRGPVKITHSTPSSKQSDCQDSFTVEDISQSLTTYENIRNKSEEVKYGNFSHIGHLTHLNLIAYALDPRYAHLPLLEEGARIQVENEIKHIASTHSLYPSTQQDSVIDRANGILLPACFDESVPHSTIKQSHNNLIDMEIAVFRTYSYDWWSEIIKASDARDQTKKFDILMFWNGEVAQTKFPTLRRVARWIYCVQGMRKKFTEKRINFYAKIGSMRELK